MSPKNSPPCSGAHQTVKLRTPPGFNTRAASRSPCPGRAKWTNPRHSEAALIRTGVMEQDRAALDRIVALVWAGERFASDPKKVRAGDMLARGRAPVWGHVSSNAGRTAGQGDCCEVSGARSNL